MYAFAKRGLADLFGDGALTSEELAARARVDPKALYRLLRTGAQERTEEEYEQLLGRAGFKLVRVVPTTEPASILEAVSE